MKELLYSVIVISLIVYIIINTINIIIKLILSKVHNKSIRFKFNHINKLLLLSAYVILIVNYKSISNVLSNYKFVDLVYQKMNLNPVKQMSSCGANIVPNLKNLTSRVFFRYFRVNFNRVCPFWHEEPQCAIEACSVDTCLPDEIPYAWSTDEPDFGWISERDDSYCDQPINKLALNNSLIKSRDMTTVSSHRSETSQSHIQYLQHQTRQDDWTEMSENDDFNIFHDDQYVNLLENPERYTGYAGPSARRVWRSIMEENCFGEQSDACLEKRVFYRIVSGLRSSISTHIAKEYLYKDGRWGVNIPLFKSAVGHHPDRLHNLYFTFLFVMRAVARARDPLIRFNYKTGNETDDKITKALIVDLLQSVDSYSETVITPNDSDYCPTVPLKLLVDEYKDGFDESDLFQSELNNYYVYPSNSQGLLNEFRNKFRNISRIMDCVTCEKCKVWGKLQILGIGTAIKITLSNANEIHLTRQEVIALINTLHQLFKSIEFVKMVQETMTNETSIASYNVLVIVVVSVFTLAYYSYKYFNSKNIQN